MSPAILLWYAGLKKKDIQIYRVHKGELEELTEIPNDFGEFVSFNKEAGTIDICACQYSTYAVAYNEIIEDTGDSNEMAPWALLTLISVLGLAGYGLKRRNN